MPLSEFAEPALLTAIQLGEYLSVSPKTVFQWSKQGRIPVIRMGSALRFDPKAIAAESVQRCGLIMPKLRIGVGLR